MKYSAAAVICILILLSSCRTLTFEEESLRSNAYPEGRRVIMTADDYGATPNINRGIEKGIEAGVINTVAAMVTFADSVDSIKSLQRRYPDVGIGLHFSITSGAPVCAPSEVPSLVKEDGSFYTIDELVLRLGRVDLDEVEKELRAQIELLERNGIDIDNLSSQHNIIHIYTPFFEVMATLAGEYGIPVRSTIPASVAFDEFSDSYTKRRATDLAVSMIFNNIFAAAEFGKYGNIEEMRNNQEYLDKRGIAHPHYLVDSFWGNPTPQNLFHILTKLPPGTSEIVFHLGVHRDGSYRASGINLNYFLMREFELMCISSPRVHRWIEELEIEKVSYDELREANSSSIKGSGP